MQRKRREKMWTRKGLLMDDSSRIRTCFPESCSEETEGIQRTIRKGDAHQGNRSWRRAILQIALGAGSRQAAAGRPPGQHCHGAVIVQFQSAPSAQSGSAVNTHFVSVDIIGIDQGI